MKKIFFLFIIFIVIPLLSFSQDHWEFVHTNDSTYIWSIEIAKDGTIFYGGSNGLFISHDHGQTWDYKYLFPNSYIFDMAFDIDSNLVCIANYKLYKFNIESNEWEFLYQPELHYQFRTLLIDGTTIFAGNDNGVFRYFNGNWEEMEFNGNTTLITDIIIDSSGCLYLGTTNWGGGGGVSESLDYGETWTLIGMGNSYIKTLAIDSQNRLYAGSTGHQEYGIGGLYRYNREEGIWDTLRLYHRVMSMCFNEEDSLYIGQYSTGGPPAGAFMSPDYGQTWYDISSGFQGGGIPNVYELEIGPDNHLYSIVQSDNSIYRSSNVTITSYEENQTIFMGDINIFPNPATSTLFIRSNNPFSNKQYLEINIYSSFGKLVHTEEAMFSGESLQINVSSLAPGIYLLEICGKDFREIGRFVKN